MVVKHDDLALRIDRLGHLVALFLRVAKELAEHPLDVFERMVVAIPQDDVVPRNLPLLALGLRFFGSATIVAAWSSSATTVSSESMHVTSVRLACGIERHQSDQAPAVVEAAARRIILYAHWAITGSSRANGQR